MPKTNFDVHMKHLKVLVKKKMMKFYLCWLNDSEQFKIYFFHFPWEIVFCVISSNCSYLKLLQNAKSTVIYLSCNYLFDTRGNIKLDS